MGPHIGATWSQHLSTKARSATGGLCTCNQPEMKMGSTLPNTLEAMKEVAQKMARHKSTTREIYGLLRDLGTMVLTKAANPTMRRVAANWFSEVLTGPET